MNADHLPPASPDHLPHPSSRGRSRAHALPRTDLGTAIETWLADGRAQGWSPRTLSDRQWTLRHFIWWLEHVEGAAPTLEAVNSLRLRSFLSYTREPCLGGRYDSGRSASARQARPSSVQTYHRHLRAFLNFCVEEGVLTQSPLRNVRPPRVPNEQVQPFTSEQVQALLQAAQSTDQRERNRTVVLLLVDTGLRVSELCALRMRDVDRATGQIVVAGKGGKTRIVYTGVTSRRALLRYLQRRRQDATPDEPLFRSVVPSEGEVGLTPNAVRIMMRKLGRAAGIEGVRVSPRTARHTFAVNFLRSGGNLFELQALMGHSDLTILRRYVALAESDLAQAHRQASPADRMKLR